MFLGSKGHNWPGSIKKSKIYNRFSHTKALLFKKKGPHFGQNSCPGECDPYDDIYDDAKDDKYDDA